MGNIHNELRSARRLTTGIGRLVGLVDGETGVERLSETLVPVIDLWGRHENWAALGGGTWGDRRTQGAVAAEFSFILIANASTSGKLMTIDELILEVAQEVELGILAEANFPVLDGSGTLENLSPRRNLLPPAGLSTGFGTQVADPLANGFMDIPSAAGTAGTQYRMNISLAPGFGVIIRPVVVNVACEISAQGRWRPLFPGELDS